MKPNLAAIEARQARDMAAKEFASAHARFQKAKQAVANLAASDLNATGKTPSEADVTAVGKEYVESLLSYNATELAYLATRSKRAPRAPKT